MLAWGRNISYYLCMTAENGNCEPMNPEASPKTAAAKTFWLLFGAKRPLEPDEIKQVMREKGDWDEADIHFEQGVDKLSDDGFGFMNADGLLELTDLGYEFGVTAALMQRNAKTATL